MDERIMPAVITDNETGAKYELDFSRETVKWAEGQGFDLSEALTKYQRTGIENLFYYSFRKNHRNVPREKVDKLREKWGGVPESLLKRLVELYTQAQGKGAVQTDEDAAKNPTVTMEL